MNHFLNRRNLFVSMGAASVLALAACSDKSNNNSTGDDDTANTGKNTVNYDESFLNSILLNGGLVYGPEDFFVSKTIVLDLGSKHSKDFYNAHYDGIQMSYDENRGVGLSLVDLSDMEEHDHEHDEEHDHSVEFSLQASTVALIVYQYDKELLWTYISKVYELLDGEGHVAEGTDVEDLAAIAVELGVENVDESLKNSLNASIVRNMTMMVENTIESSPALLDNRVLWDGNLNDSDAVDGWLTN